jgi:hypothetical protein
VIEYRKPQDVDCPVCHRPTEILDVVDFNKNCLEPQGVHLQLSGKPIYYNRCTDCGFVFAPEMWSWSREDFQLYVYNADYGVVDRDYAEIRPKGDAEGVMQLFPAAREAAEHLDYGSGAGLLTDLLNARGWRSTAYDPFIDGQAQRPERKFGLITAFEVFEHVPSVDDLMRDLKALAEEEAVILFSTLVSDTSIAPNSRLNWWYASPRNGHISLYTTESLKRLARQAGWGFASFSPARHCFVTPRIPAWAQSTIRKD